jgi:hypothetical protein
MGPVLVRAQASGLVLAFRLDQSFSGAPSCKNRKKLIMIEHRAFAAE